MSSQKYSRPITDIIMSITSTMWSNPSLVWMPECHLQIVSPQNPIPTDCCCSMLIIIGSLLSQAPKIQSPRGNQVPRINFEHANMFRFFKTTSRNMLSQSLSMSLSNLCGLSTSLENICTTFSISYSWKYRECPSKCESCRSLVILSLIEDSGSKHVRSL